MAVTPTTNHGYKKQDRGDENWDVALNETLDLLDVDVMLRDTEANRPSPGTESRVFLATDTQKLFYDDGSSWNLVLSQDFSDINNSSHSTTHEVGGSDELDLGGLTATDTVEFTGGDGAQFSPGVRPQLIVDESSRTDRANGHIEFYTDNDTRRGWIGWRGPDKNVQMFNQFTGANLLLTSNVKIDSGNLVDGGNSTIYDNTNGFVPNSALEGDGSIGIGNVSVDVGGSTTFGFSDLSSNSHAATHKAGGADEINISQLQTNLTEDQVPMAESDSTLGSSSNLQFVDSSNGGSFRVGKEPASGSFYNRPFQLSHETCAGRFERFDGRDGPGIFYIRSNNDARQAVWNAGTFDVNGARTDSFTITDYGTVDNGRGSNVRIAADRDGRVGINEGFPDEDLEVNGTTQTDLLKLDAEPEPGDPANNQTIIWHDENTGDLKAKIQEAGTVKTVTLADFSAN